MNIVIEEITPEMAKNYLTCNTDNRKLRAHRVAQYATQIKRGQWLDTGDPIRFGVTGRLIDGQHRLAAIIAADIAVKAVVVRGVPEEAFKVIDSGLNRTPADTLPRNTSNATNKAAAIRLIYVYKAGADPRLTQDKNAVTRIDVSDFYALHTIEVDDANLEGRRMNAAFVGGNQSAWTAFIFLAREIDATATDVFLHGIVTGANLDEGDPRLALRNWLANNRWLPSSGHHLGALIKAWNAWVKKDKRMVIRIREDETFPTLASL